MASLEEASAKAKTLYDMAQIAAQYEEKEMREKLEDEMINHQQQYVP